MDWVKPYLVSRVRVQALRAMVLGGVHPRPEQLFRAIEPVLGDLLPLPPGPAASAAARAQSRALAIALGIEGDRRDALGSTRAARGPGRIETEL